MGAKRVSEDPGTGRLVWRRSGTGRKMGRAQTLFQVFPFETALLRRQGVRYYVSPVTKALRHMKEEIPPLEHG
jgi:hypothetical protein